MKNMGVPAGIMSVALFLILTTAARAQVPFEYFAGHKQSSLDLMFFRFFKKDSLHQTRWLFFNRNRAVIDYRMTPSSFTPRFGFTEALSYNHPEWKGLAPVAVVQVLSNGVWPKAGLQFARIRTSITIFTWLVCETLHKARIDHFLMLRYTPELNARFKLFAQAESLSVVPVAGIEGSSYLQRFRLGLQRSSFQAGAGIDLNQVLNGIAPNTTNAGAFLRYEF
jgi:hypothetical protein